MEKELWRRNHRGDAVEEENMEKNHGGTEIMEENCGGEFMGEKPLKRHHDWTS